MNITKRGNSYRIKQMYKGKVYSTTIDHKPTQKEAIMIVAELLEKENIHDRSMTFRDAAEKYIKDRSNVLSPTTIREYTRSIDRLGDFSNLKIVSIDQEIIQQKINDLSADLSPKTVRNYHGFISSVLGVFRKDLRLSTVLPQKLKNEPYIPTDDDVKAIMSYARTHCDGKYIIPIVLGCHGLRRSEICALTGDDVDGDVIHINKALVMDSNNKWVLKQTKTTDSERDVIIPLEIADQIKKQGYAFKGFPNDITDFMTQAEKSQGIPHFSLHKLRHYYASTMAEHGYQEEDILYSGGWSTDYVMKAIYRHAKKLKSEDARREASQKLSKSFME